MVSVPVDLLERIRFVSVKSGNVTFDETLAVGGHPEHQWPLPKGKYKIYLIHSGLACAESTELQVGKSSKVHKMTVVPPL
jgi:hypothetical protein